MSAIVQEVEFYFHGQAMSRKAKYGNNGPAKADYIGQLGSPEVPLVGNRPLVYVGGGSLFASQIGSDPASNLIAEPFFNWIIGTLNSDSGLQSGGSYPYRALWFEPQGGIWGGVTDNYEYPNGLFPEVIDNAEIVLLPNKTDPSAPDWLKADIKWGHLEVSSPAGKENEAPSGPAYKGNWEKTIATGSVASDKVYNRKPRISTIGSNINLYTYQFTPPVVSGDQTWSGNITICGDITVLPGTTLTISSGTTINFVQNWDINQSGRLNLDISELNIKGKLVADGVIFQSEPLQNLSRTNTDWSGIVVSEEGSIDIKDSTIQNSIYEIYLDAPPASAIIEAYINEAITPIQIGGSGPYSLSDAPEGISISDSGSITGEPTQTGTFNMTVTARDAIKNIVTHSLTLRVIQRLVVSPISNVNATQNVAITPIQVNVSGGQTPYTYSLFGEPEVISISSRGLITGTPTEVGTFTVKVKVQDAAHKAVSDSFDIFVSSVITPLTLAPISDITATQNVAITPIQVNTSSGHRSYAYDIKSDPEAGAGLSISDSGLITGTPTASKNFKVTVTVENRHDALVDAAPPPVASRSFTMRVRPRVTVSAIDNITITQNTSITPIQVSASGGQTPYKYSIESNPANGSGLTVDSSSGRITGKPTKAGTFTVTITVTDAHGRTGTRSFSMTVNASTPVSALTIAEINDISVKISAVQTNAPITPIQASVSGGQTPYEYALSSTPATGSGLTIDSSSGKITGTPTKASSFTLTVKVTDNANKTATESFSMAVSLIGDFNGDGVVNLSDHSLFVAAFGLSEGDGGYNAEMDMNGDGTINTADFLIFVSHFPNADQFF
ncbi:MAG: hypothetical protein F4W91_06085 [Gemmatimonadetes bacterium]|nr:hypothetical protein [Gemmatimonadota bacterium]